MRDWPTYSVELNHLELMGCAMALMAEESTDGLSEPQRAAKDKLEAALGPALANLRDVSTDAQPVQTWQIEVCAEHGWFKEYDGFSVEDGGYCPHGDHRCRIVEVEQRDVLVDPNPPQKAPA